MQENILSKKLNLGLNFSTPNGGVTSPLLKESMPSIHEVDGANGWQNALNLITIRFS